MVVWRRDVMVRQCLYLCMEAVLQLASNRLISREKDSKQIAQNRYMSLTSLNRHQYAFQLVVDDVSRWYHPHRTERPNASRRYDVDVM